MRDFDVAISVSPRKPLTRLIGKVHQLHMLRVVPYDAVCSASSRGTVARRLDARNPGVTNGDCTPAAKCGNPASIIVNKRHRVWALRELCCVNLTSFYSNKVIAVAVGARPID